MQRNLLAALVSLSFAAPAVSEEMKPAGMPDMKTMGPQARWPKNEKKDKDELNNFYKKWAELEKKGDVNGLADMVDFPVMMMTDDSKGKFSMMEFQRDQWVGMVKPFVEPMKNAKDLKMTQKASCFILSDDLASCTGEGSMSMGKMKNKFKGQWVMIRQGGAWKTKTMMEAGWGDMKPPGQGGSGTQEIQVK